jgi:hypothetical protein
VNIRLFSPVAVGLGGSDVAMSVLVVLDGTSGGGLDSWGGLDGSGAVDDSTAEDDSVGVASGGGVVGVCGMNDVDRTVCSGSVPIGFPSGSKNVMAGRTEV